MTHTEAFLARIGLTGTPVTHTKEFLGAVQNACVLSIPYENLDILDGKPLSLKAEDIYRKIVTEHRGGYCFELNALLHHMLAEMGFTVNSRFARYLRGESKIPFRRHGK
ncbi:MAG: arylamine N-acetyltransferase, partial [Clostridia bacterium]|nr:arylamine N-acetyltransferase [Clostridia bacterium]